MLAAGVRGSQHQGQRFSPFYQVLLGGLSTRFRTDYEWPMSIDTEAPRGGRRLRPPSVAETASDATPTRKRRAMTAKERQAVSDRMTANWAERRKNASPRTK